MINKLFSTWKTLFCPIKTKDAQHQMHANIHLHKHLVCVNNFNVNDVIKRINSASIMIAAKEKRVTWRYSCHTIKNGKQNQIFKTNEYRMGPKEWTP